MQKFETKGKATIAIFFNDIPKILEVRTANGMLYFFRETEGQKRLKFNLAQAGIFTLNCIPDTFDILPISIHPLKINLPTPDRQEDKKFTIVFNPGLTDTPARNFFKKGLIEVGTNFVKQPYPIRVFILLHEIAHFKYSDESNCDLWAAQEFIKKGFNNSTAYYALKNVLNPGSVRNQQRIIKLFKNLHR